MSLSVPKWVQVCSRNWKGVGSCPSEFEGHSLKILVKRCAYGMHPFNPQQRHMVRATRSNQLCPSETKWVQVRMSEPKLVLMKKSVSMLEQSCPSQTQWAQARASEPKRVQKRSSETKRAQVIRDQVIFFIHYCIFPYTSCVHLCLLLFKIIPLRWISYWEILYILTKQ